MLISTQVEVVVEFGVELGNNLLSYANIDMDKTVRYPSLKTIPACLSLAQLVLLM